MIGWIFSWIIAAAGTSAGWLYPFFGLMVYYTLSILRPGFLWYWSFPDQSKIPQFSYFVALSTLIGWAMDGLGDWSNLRRIRWPLLGLGLYLLAGLYASVFEAPAQGDWGRDWAWTYYSTQLKIGLMALATVTLITQAPAIKAFGLMAVLTLTYVGESFNEWYLKPGGSNYLRVNGWGGIDNNGVAMVMVMGVPLAFFFIVNRTTLSPGLRWALVMALVLVAANTAATGSAIGLVIAVGAVGAAALMAYDGTLGLRAVSFLGVACMVHTVLFSFSRGGQLGLIMVGVVLFLVAIVALPRKLLTLGLGLVLVLIALRLAGPEVRDRFASIWVSKEDRDVSAASRFDTWNAAWRCMWDHPMGVGPRNFNLVSQYYGLDMNKSVHNLFLQTGADYGFLGMLGLGLFYFGAALQTFRASFTRTARRLVWPRYYCQMVVVSMAGFLMCSMFIGMESVEVGFIIALLGLCCVAHVRTLEAAEAEAESDTLPEGEEVPADDQPERVEPMPA